MLPITLLTTLLLAICVAADPVIVRRAPVSLPLTRRLNLTSAHSLLRHDQSRAKFLKQKGSAKAAGLDSRRVVNEAVDSQVVNYIASIGVGSPATQYQLLVDSGSSNTWIGAGRAYHKTSTSTKTKEKVVCPPILSK